MQLDKTRIAIRQREYVDILDLALRVIRVYAWPLLAALCAGIVPMMVLDSWLLADYQELDFELGFPAQYMFYMTLLIVVETPLATAPATLCLGQVVFTERPDARAIARDFRRSLPQLLRYQVLLRVWHIRWPYLNEVILLERNPMQRKTAGGESTLDRGRILHQGNGGDLFARWFFSVAVGTMLFASLWLSIFLLRMMLLSRWEWGFDRPMYTVFFQLALWVVVSYFTVVRFLSYLDLRIRREGWEVELMLRAERARLTRQSR